VMTLGSDIHEQSRRRQFVDAFLYEFRKKTSASKSGGATWRVRDANHKDTAVRVRETHRSSDKSGDRVVRAVRLFCEVQRRRLEVLCWLAGKNPL
jgi:hypothetical protein